jgi:RNA recognition motif-containing protein
MTSDEDAEKAISTLNGTTLMDRTLIVNEARPQTMRDRRDGFKNQKGFNKRGSGLGSWR